MVTGIHIKIETKEGLCVTLEISTGDRPTLIDNYMTNPCHSSYKLLLYQTLSNGALTRQVQWGHWGLLSENIFLLIVHDPSFFMGAISLGAGKHFSCWSYLSSLGIFFPEAIVILITCVFTLVFHLKIFLREKDQCYITSVTLQCGVKQQQQQKPQQQQKNTLWLLKIRENNVSA